MRLALVLAVLVSGCGLPYKYHTFQVPQGTADIIWVFRDGSLYRCAQAPAGYPVCQLAQYITDPMPGMPLVVVPTPPVAPRSTPPARSSAPARPAPAKAGEPVLVPSIETD